MSPISIHGDSQSILSRAYSQVYNGKSRHIGMRHIKVRGLIIDGVVNIVYVKSAENLADPLTKGLTKNFVSQTSKGMGLTPTRQDHH